MDSDIFQLYAKVDSLLSADGEGDRKEAYTSLKSVRDQYANDPEFLWRMAKVSFMYSKVFEKDKKRRKELCTEGRDCAYSAAAIEPENVNVQKWCALTVGSMKDFMSVNEKIVCGYKFKEHIDKALELCADDCILHHLRARWCFGVAAMNAVERQAAKTLFAEPPRSCYQDALDGFLKAEVLRPNQWIQNLLYIAKSYIKLKDLPSALPYLELIRTMDAPMLEDKIAKEEALKLLSKKFKQKKTQT